MPLCDQFIYTTGKSEFKTGYQIISKSEGITDRIVDELSDYLYPLGINPAEFRESRSLLVLSNDNLAYSIVKNIGIGYDGRENTIYNHTIIISKKTFLELKCDTRVLDNYFKEEPLRKERHLPLLNIENIEIFPNYELIREITPIVLEEILKNLFKSRKVAIVETDQVRLIPNVLSLVPPSMRLVSFSTLVNQPDKQPKYNIIQIPRQAIEFLLGDFEVIDTKETVLLMKKRQSDMIQKNIDYFMSVIDDKQRLYEIFNSFEELSDQHYVNKINLILNYEQFKSTNDSKEKEKFAYDIFESVKKIKSDKATKFLQKVKESLGEDQFQNYYTNHKIMSLISDPEVSINRKDLENVLREIESFNEKYRMILLSKLVEYKIDEFLKKGSSLLVDVFHSNSWFRNEIMQLFVQNHQLNKCVIDIFRDDKIPLITKQEMFKIILDVSEIYNPSFIALLLKHLPFDLRSQNDSGQAMTIIRNMFMMLEIKKVESKIILEIINSIRTSIHAVVQKSNRIKARVDTAKNIHEIIISLKNALNYAEVESNDQRIRNQINEEKEIIENIDKKIKPSPKKPRLLFFDI